MGIWIFLLCIILLVLIVIYIRNKIIVHFNATQRAWADVISYERQKIKTLDELTLVVEKYIQFEQNTLTQVTALRQNIMNLPHNASDQQLQQVEQLTHEMIKSLSIVVENYPELKADQLYVQMMTEIDQQNENVAAGITIFNRNVEWFNNYIQIFPNNLINTLLTGKKAIRPFRDSQAQQQFDYRPNFSRYSS